MLLRHLHSFLLTKKSKQTSKQAHRGSRVLAAPCRARKASRKGSAFVNTEAIDSSFLLLLLPSRCSCICLISVHTSSHSSYTVTRFLCAFVGLWTCLLFCFCWWLLLMIMLFYLFFFCEREWNLRRMLISALDTRRVSEHAKMKKHIHHKSMLLLYACDTETPAIALSFAFFSRWSVCLFC